MVTGTDFMAVPQHKTVKCDVNEKIVSIKILLDVQLKKNLRHIAIM